MLNMHCSLKIGWRAQICLNEKVFYKIRGRGGVSLVVSMLAFYSDDQS